MFWYKLKFTPNPLGMKYWNILYFYFEVIFWKTEKGKEDKGETEKIHHTFFTFLQYDFKLITVILAGRSEFRNARREGISFFSVLCCCVAVLYLAMHTAQQKHPRRTFILSSLSSQLGHRLWHASVLRCPPGHNSFLFGFDSNPLQARNLTLSRNTSRLSINQNSSKHWRRCLRKTYYRLMPFLQLLSFQLSPMLMFLKSQNWQIYRHLQIRFPE